jgi:outer membrane receptor protein involved in Fe transport
MQVSRPTSTLLCGVTLLGVSIGIGAQDVSRPEAGQLVEIVVTSTRIVRDGYEAPTPTTVISTEDIEKSAQVSLADYINQLPELGNSLAPTTNRNGATSGAAFINLRGLGTSRTLVLLDGRRVAPSALTGNVDFNLLPTSIVQNVDIVTGGASSAWGSDAVAGVVNVVLDKRFSGFKSEVTYGMNDNGDGEQFKGNLTFGADFADDRGHFLITAEHSELKDAGNAGSRDWYEGYNIVDNPAFVAGGSQPRRLLVPGVGLSRSTPGGLISTGPLAGTQFLADGSPATFDSGVVSGLLSYGGDAYLAGADASLINPVEWDTAFVRAQFELTPSVTLFAEGGYGDSDSTYVVRYYQRDANIAISRQNAYLDAATAARMDALGLASFTLGKLHTDLPAATVESSRELMRGVVGGEGTFGAGWSWDAYYQYGQTDFDTAAINNPITANYNRAVDAVVSNGNIVCRSSLTVNDGCVPLDIFGTSGISPAARSYILGVAHQLTVIKQQVAAANLRGEPFASWAGPVSIAAGVEYRKEEYEAKTPDAVSLTNGFFLGNYKPSDGEYDVQEAYLETVVPLLTDKALVQRLEFGGAVRWTDYSTSGEVTTWKTGLSWDLNDQLRLRGTYSADIRAPNLNELFLASSTTNFAIVDPVTGASYSVPRVIAGNPELEPEDAKTTSFGAVYRPAWLSSFSFSADYYDITIDDSIFTPDGQIVIDQCVAGVTSLCSAIIRNASNVITQLRVLPQNVLSETISGIDFEASWRGPVTVRVLASHIMDREVDSFGVTLDYDGVTGDGFGVAKWRGMASVTYEGESFSTTLTGRYVKGGVLKAEWGPLDIDRNDVSDRTYVDLSATYDLSFGGTQLQLFGVVQNLFDRDPPVSVVTSGNAFTSIGTNASFFDTLGRQFRLGLRMKM